MKTSERGISLIVLVITIVVMIILATAIILSLNSSNISGKASEARISSDLANKKEAASVYISEYEIKVAKGKIDKTTTTLNDYVKAELKKAGISADDIYITDDSEILLGTAAMFADISIGTEVQGYKLDAKEASYTTDGKEQALSNTGTFQTQTINRDEDISWTYVGIDEDGNALILGNISSGADKLFLGYSSYNWCSGPSLINTICNKLYSGSMGTARSIDIDDVIRILEYDKVEYSYYPQSGGYNPSKVSRKMTLRELCSSVNYNVSNFSEVVKNNLDSIIVNEIAFSKEEISTKYNTARNNIIFQNSYWLASNSNVPNLIDGWVENNLKYVTTNSVGGCTPSANVVNCPEEYSDAPGGESADLRPIVKLSPNLNVKYENNKVTLS